MTYSSFREISRLLLGIALLASQTLAAQSGPQTGSGAYHRRDFGAEPHLILPLGDSITHGGQGFVSYRYELWYRLQAAVGPVDFVGRQDSIFSGFPSPLLYPNYWRGFDRDHEGYWGFRTDQIHALSLEAARAAPAETILVHLGTNDIGQLGAVGIDHATEHLTRILDAYRSIRPVATFLVAQVIPIGPGTSYFQNAAQVAPLNAALAALVAARHRPQTPIVLVDQNTGFDLQTDMQSDGLHPNASGEARMAAVWELAVLPWLPRPKPPAQPSVVLLDPSFEGANLSEGVVLGSPLDLDWRFGYTSQTFQGVFNPTAASYNGAAGSGTPLGADGDEVAYLFHIAANGETALAFQTLETTLEPNRSYTLTVAIGNRLPSNPYGPSVYGGYRIELLAGNEVIASSADQFVPPPGSFQDATLTVDSNSLAPTLIGEALTIRLGLTLPIANAATDFDHVRLTVQ